MRGEQLAEIASRHLSPSFRFFFSPISSELSNSILILTKGAMLTATDDLLQRLKTGRNKILIDPVDNPIPKHILPFTDTILAASMDSYTYYRDHNPSLKVSLVDHHIDPRIQNLHLGGGFKGFGIGYFGMPENTVISNQLSKHVHFESVRTEIQDESWIGNLSKYPAHYAIRAPKAPSIHKPFLKGFIAAICGANILVQGTESEAVRWLGNDYPYLLKDPVSEASILRAIRAMQQSYESKEWTRGLEIMRSIKSKVSDDKIAKQLLGAIG